MQLFFYVEFQDANGREGHVSYTARQLRLYLHGGFAHPEWAARGLTPDRFTHCWESRESGTVLNLGLESKPGETIDTKSNWLTEVLPDALEATIFSPKYGIPDEAVIRHKRAPAPVVSIETYRKRVA